jgi:hypothetical protein
MAKTCSGPRRALILAAASLTSSQACAEIRPVAFAEQFPERILAAHNEERSRFGEAPLVWDRELGAEAATYAAQMASTGLFQHSGKTQPDVGENLWMGTRGAFSVEEMVGGWTAEKRLFVPGVFPAISRTGNWDDVGHYTQMIWAATNRIGCALASTARTDFLVCRYSPAGNVDGVLIQPPRQ